MEDSRCIISDGGNDGFDCNICLEMVEEPVVTFCGHLYCWPCIHTWLSSPAPMPTEEPRDLQRRPHRHRHLRQRCPVCKSEVSHATLIPLYGGGRTAGKLSRPRHDGGIGPAVPRRPPGIAPERPAHHHLSRRREGWNLAENDSGTLSGMVGEMVYSRMFGNVVNPYPVGGGGGGGVGAGRSRRSLMAAERSLSRVWVFLCCGALLCLFAF